MAAQNQRKKPDGSVNGHPVADAKRWTKVTSTTMIGDAW